MVHGLLRKSLTAEQSKFSLLAQHLNVGLLLPAFVARESEVLLCNGALFLRLILRAGGLLFIPPVTLGPAQLHQRHVLVKQETR